MIKQVIFDLGRVLLEWEPEKLAFELSSEVDSFHHDVWKITRHPSWLDFDKGNLHSPDIVEIHADQYPIESLKLFMERVPFILTPLPEGLKLLEVAKKKGVKLYILSNMSHDFYEHLIRSYPFLSEFDGGIYSCHHHLAKPDLKIFHKLLHEYRLNPSETLFVDDIPENIEAAKSLGIKTVLFTKSKHTYEEFIAALQSQ